ncbi:MAG: hypothetical protein IJG52_02240 [Lachnospiraceae bacterium]|nr:hypothetical protein [Lachnospiraceae bacterium]
MDRYELKITLKEIADLASEGEFEEAAEVADQVDWRRVKSVRDLCRASDIYKINRRYEDSRRVLEFAYAKYPKGRNIIFSLCELELKLGGYVRALQLYNQYRRIAPDDPDGYILQYKLYKAQSVGVRERIAVLEELERRDFREKWAYELASLYYEAGERSMCISECDELIAFFGTGRYVLKALELKASLTELTPAQKKKYAALTRAVSARRGKPAPQEDTRQQSALSARREPGEAPETVTVRETKAQAVPAEETEVSVKAAQAAPNVQVEPNVQAAPEVPMYERAVAVDEPASAEVPAGEAGPKEMFPDDGQGDTESEDDEILLKPKEVASTQEIPWDYAEELPSFETAPEPVPEAAAEADLKAEPEPWFETADDFSQEDMQKVIAKGLEELHNYDTYLAQETDGQYALVMQENPSEEKQIPGQLDLEEIMQEWEKVRRDLYDGSGDPGEKKDTAGKGRNLQDTQIYAAVNPEEDDFYSERRGGRRADTGRHNTKSWDRKAVHDALRIRDNDDDGVHFDTSLFVTEGGGEFPPEYIPEVQEQKGDGAKRSFVSRDTGHYAVPYLHSEDSMLRMTEALKDVRLEGPVGNIVITGDEGSGTMSLAREMLRRYRRMNESFLGQIVKTEGHLMNRSNLSRVIPRIPFGALVVQRASLMSDETTLAMAELLSAPERDVIVLLIDRKGNMDAFLRDHKKLAAMFGARVDIAALSVETLLGYAREFALQQGCEIDEYGVGALQSRVLSMQTIEHSVTLEDMRNLVDEAIYYAGRRLLPDIRDTLSGKRKEGVLVLHERDFLHY